jgi:hypothetical protein
LRVVFSPRLQVWLMAADQGADQIAADALIDGDVASCGLVLKFRNWCIRHCLALMNKKQLKRLEVRKFFSKTAQIVNSWRLTSNAKLLFKAFVELCGSREKALEFVGRVIPRPLRGRWVSIAKVEDYLLLIGIDLLRAAWVQALVAKAHGKIADAKKILAKGGAELGIELGETEESFVVKEAKTLRGALVAIQGDEYWRDLQIASISRRPVSHQERWMEKATKDGEIVLVSLVSGRARNIFTEWETIIRSGALSFLVEIPDLREQSSWIAFAVLVNLEMATDYNLRIVQPCESYPKLLLWIVVNRHDVRCEGRLRLFQDLLAAEDICDETTLKVRWAFRFEIEYGIANGGQIRKRFWSLFHDVARMLAADTQPIEGINNEIKAISTIAPGIGWQLLSSRTTARRAVMAYKKADARVHFASVCASFHAAAQEILADGSRWTTSPDDFPDSQRAVKRAPTSAVVQHCTAVALVALKREFALWDLNLKPSTELAISFCINGTVGSHCFLVTLEHRRVHYGVEVRQVDLSESDYERFELLKDCFPGDGPRVMGKVALVYPFVPQRLLDVLDAVHFAANESGDGEGTFEVSVLHLLWGCGNSEEAL